MRLSKTDWSDGRIIQLQVVRVPKGRLFITEYGLPYIVVALPDVFLVPYSYLAFLKMKSFDFLNKIESINFITRSLGKMWVGRGPLNE